MAKGNKLTLPNPSALLNTKNGLVIYKRGPLRKPTPGETDEEFRTKNFYGPAANFLPSLLEAVPPLS